MSFPLIVVLLAWSAVPVCYAAAVVFSIEISLPGMVTWVYCSTSIILLVLGIFLGGALKVKARSARMSEKGIKSVTLLLVVCSLVGAYAYFTFWTSKGIVLNLLDAESFLEVNSLYAEGEDEFGGLFGRLYIIPILAVVWVEYLRSKGIIKSGVAFLLNLFFIFCLVSPRRAFLFYAIMNWAGAYFLGKGKLSGRDTVWALGLVVGLVSVFLYSQVALNKASDSSVGELIRPLVVYLLGSLAVMDELLSTRHFEGTALVLNVPARIANQLFGAGFDVDMSIPFVAIPDLANTVPFQYYLIKGAGLPGLLFVSFALGFAFSKSYRHFKVAGGFFSFYVCVSLCTGVLLSVREGLFFTYAYLFLIAVAWLVAWLVSSKLFSKAVS